MTDKSLGELIEQTDALIADFYAACDDFIERMEATAARERDEHDELMRVLRRDEE